MKTHWKKTLNKNYLGAHDLDDGEGGFFDADLKIAKVVSGKVSDPNGDTSLCNVAHFEGGVKPMILNVGACQRLQEFSGSKYIEEWAGLAIRVYVDPEVSAFGSVVEALRIRPKQPTLEKPELDSNHERFDELVEAYKEKGQDAIDGARQRFYISAETEVDIKAQKDAA